MINLKTKEKARRSCKGRVLSLSLSQTFSSKSRTSVFTHIAQNKKIVIIELIFFFSNKVYMFLATIFLLLYNFIFDWWFGAEHVHILAMESCWNLWKTSVPLCLVFSHTKPFKMMELDLQRVDYLQVLHFEILYRSKRRVAFRVNCFVNFCLYFILFIVLDCRH
jgi:hypothetical protein